MTKGPITQISDVRILVDGFLKLLFGNCSPRGEVTGEISNQLPE